MIIKGENDNMKKGECADYKRVVSSVEPVVYDIIQKDKKNISEFVRCAILYYLKHNYSKDYKRLAPRKTNDRIGDLIDYVMQNPLFLNYITIRKGNNYHIRTDFKRIHNLYGADLKEFEERYLDRIEEKQDNDD
jgi:hypothetical protein